MYFSVRLLSVLRGYSFFSSPPQRPMNSDFEGFSIPYCYSLHLFSYLEKEPVFSGLNRGLPHSKPALYHLYYYYFNKMKTVVIVAYTLRTQTKLINWSLLVLTPIPTDMLTPEPLVIISADLSVYRRIAFRLEQLSTV